VNQKITTEDEFNAWQSHTNKVHNQYHGSRLQVVNEVKWQAKNQEKKYHQAEPEPDDHWTSNGSELQAWTGRGRTHYTTQSFGANTFAHRNIGGRRTRYDSLNLTKCLPSLQFFEPP